MGQAEAAARKRGVTLTVQLPDQPLRIRHDPLRVGQVVSNIVGNALKFTPRGGTVRVIVSPTRDGARIVVADTGAGIDAAELPHIFERFYRGSSSNEARGSGSGLGLAIVKSIVDMHGGRISVESRLGTGTTVTVTLPRDPRAAAIGADAHAAVLARADGPATARAGSPATASERGEPADRTAEAPLAADVEPEVEGSSTIRPIVAQCGSVTLRSTESCPGPAQRAHPAGGGHQGARSAITDQPSWPASPTPAPAGYARDAAAHRRGRCGGAARSRAARGRRAVPDAARPHATRHGRARGRAARRVPVEIVASVPHEAAGSVTRFMMNGSPSETSRALLDLVQPGAVSTGSVLNATNSHSNPPKPFWFNEIPAPSL